MTAGKQLGPTDLEILRIATKALLHMSAATKAAIHHFWNDYDKGARGVLVIRLRGRGRLIATYEPEVPEVKPEA